MRFDSGRVGGGWAYPNARYSQGDSVHVVGYMDCFRYDLPTTCAYSSMGFEIGGGNSNGGTGTSGYRFPMDANHCSLNLSVPSSISFDCYAHPDRGWDTNASYVWFSAYSGQGGQDQDLYVTNVETEWSGITPGFSDSQAGCSMMLKDTGDKSAGSDQRETGTSACPISQYLAGDPINTHSGTFDYSLVDLSISTSAGPLALERFYSSQLSGQSGGPLGPGWTHNQDTYLTFGTSSTGTLTDVFFKAETANLYRFRANADGTFTPYPGVFASLTEDPGPPVSYTLVDSRQNTYQFDDQGRVLTWTNSTAQSFTYSYDASGRLAQVDGPSGLRQLTLTYDAQARISQVSDQAGRQVSFGYDVAGNLSSSTDVLGQTWTYAYDSFHHLTQVTDPDGATVLTVTYDAAGRAIQQTNGEGQLQAGLAFTSNTSTTVTDGLGNARTDTYSYQNTGTRQQDASGGLCSDPSIPTSSPPASPIHPATLPT